MSRLVAALLVGAVAGAAWGQEPAGAGDEGAAALLEPVPYERSEFRIGRTRYAAPRWWRSVPCR